MVITAAGDSSQRCKDRWGDYGEADNRTGDPSQGQEDKRTTKQIDTFKTTSFSSMGNLLPWLLASWFGGSPIQSQGPRDRESASPGHALEHR